jgi:regulatory protein
MPDSTQTLRVAALRLLTRRDHSRAELEKKLAAQAESGEQLDSVLDRLQEEHLLSDQRYASQRIVSRGKRYGNARLKQELRQQGVSDEDILSALPDAGSEADRCHSVWARKFRQLPQNPEERAKQMRFLQYRGSSGDAIQQIFRRSNNGAEE